MTVRVLAAVTGASWEPTLVASLEGPASGLSVVRRCVDLPDLLAAAASGTARAVLLSAELRRLDRDALARLAAADVAVVGLFTPGDEVAETRLRQLGVEHVLRADVPPAELAAAVTLAMSAPRATTGSGYADPAAAATGLPGNLLGGVNGLNGLAGIDGPGGDDGPEPGTGRLVAVWGPTGAPGRTTVAVGVAAELAAAGASTVLADADVYGGAVAQVLGFLDEAPGLAAAARLANLGRLDLTGLARVAPTAGPHLRVLTGISRPDRWTELRPAALEQVWALCRSLAAWTVVDCGFSLERDEELSFDTTAPRRNGATLGTLEAADVVLAVGAADPVGVQRLVRGLAELREAVPGVLPRVVLTRVRRSAVGADPEAQLASALERYAGVREVTFVPDDRDAHDRALLEGRTLAEVAPDSPARHALVTLAASLDGRPARVARRRLLRR